MPPPFGNSHPFSNAAEWICLASLIITVGMSVRNAIKCLCYWRSGHSHGHRPIEDKVSPPSFYVSLLCHFLVFLLPGVYMFLDRKVGIFEIFKCFLFYTILYL
jgi:hypothetical protein